MAVTLFTTTPRRAGLSTDTKPTGVPPGSSFWEYDTGLLYKTYDGTNWIVFEAKSLSGAGTFNLQQAAATYDLFTATSGSVVVEGFWFTLPASPDVTNDITITSISIQTDTTVVVTLLTSAAGAKANLVASTTFSYLVPFTLPSTKKIQLTIAGGAADASTACTTRVRYQPVGSAGYLA